jgi:choline dehydrogenase
VVDTLVVGGGTAGCVLAARLSEDPSHSVCVLEAGTDYGPLAENMWPGDILDAGSIAETHGWGLGGEDGRSLGGRILGGSSAVNACMVLRGTPADYDEWGAGWTYDELSPFLDRAEAELRTAPANTTRPTPFHRAFLDAARTVGADATPFPANVVGGTRWSAALAYLEPARARENLEIVDGVLVDRVVLDGPRATGVVAADGRTFDASRVILAAGAYFSAAILLRSGIGPGLAVDLPVGERLLDHHGTAMAWTPTERLQAETAAHVADHHLFEAHAVITAASSACPAGSWDLHLLPWIYRGPEDGRFLVSLPLFHMKPRSTGRLTLRSSNPSDAPHIERGFLTRAEDLPPLLEAIELARTIAATKPVAELLDEELRPGDVAATDYVKATMRNYFHPAGTCPLGEVVDVDCRVLGVEGLLVADASIMPTIPRANTNLTTAAIAERAAAILRLRP